MTTLISLVVLACVSTLMTFALHFLYAPEGRRIRVFLGFVLINGALFAGYHFSLPLIEKEELITKTTVLHESPLKKTKEKLLNQHAALPVLLQENALSRSWSDDLVQMELVVENALLSHIHKFIVKSEDQVAVLFMQDFIAFLKVLEKRSPTIAAEWIRGELTWEAVESFVPKEIKIRLLQSANLVYLRQKERSYMPPELIQLTLKKLTFKAKSRLGEDFYLPGHEIHDQKQVTDERLVKSVIELYENTLRLKPSLTPIMVKYMLGKVG